MELKGPICRCNKLIFHSRRRAKEHIKRNPHIRAKRVYACPTSNVYHITSSEEKPKLSAIGVRFDSERILAELKESVSELSSREIVNTSIKYMEEVYSKNGNYKFTTSDVVDHLKKTHPSANKARVGQAISDAKRRTGEIVNLDETVPGVRGRIKYFTTKTILEKLTDPNNKEMEATAVALIQNSPNVAMANRFDKIDTVLGEIKAQLKGLAQGYSEISKNGGSSNSDEIATRVVEMLSDLTNKDSFIYSIRDEFASHAESMAAGASSSEDYKKGLKDGIRLAIEMKLNG